VKALVRVLLLVFACSFGNVSGDHLHADDPVSLVEEVIGFIFSEVGGKLDVYKADPEALRTMVRTELMPVLDVDYSARLVLGRAGRGLPREKIDEFSEVMSKLLINRYSQGLLYFSSEVEVRVLPQRGDLNDKLTRVRSRVRLPKGGEAPIDYAFHKTADGWKAFDVIVEGISYITTYRNQIMPDVQANGVDSVIARLGSGQFELPE
jgi:phospholipid transport system substrate-binding protein